METGDDKTSVTDKQTVESAGDTSTSTAPTSVTEQLIQQIHQIKNDVESNVESTLDASVTYKTEIEEEKTGQDKSQSDENKSSEDQKAVESESAPSANTTNDQNEKKAVDESEKTAIEEKKEEKKEEKADESNASPSETTVAESIESSAKEDQPKIEPEEKKEETLKVESSVPTEVKEEKKEAEKVESPEQKQDDNKETSPAEEKKVPEQSVDTKEEANKEQKEEQVSTEVKQEATATESAATTTASNEANVNQLARTVSTPSNESDAAIAQILLRLQVLLQRQNGVFTTPLAAAAKPATAAPIQPPSDILIYNVLQQLLQRYGSATLPPLNPATQTIVHENDTRQVLDFLRTVINTDTGSSNDQTFNNSVNLDQVNRVLTHLIEIHQTEQANRPSEDLDPSLIKQVLQLLLQSFASTVAITNARNSNELNFFRCSSCHKVFVQVSYRFNKQ